MMKVSIVIDFENVNNTTIKPVLAAVLKILREEQLLDDGELDTISTIPERKNLKRLLEAFRKNLAETGMPAHNRIHLKNVLADISTTQNWHDGMSISDFLHALKLGMLNNQKMVAYHNAVMKQLSTQPSFKRNITTIHSHASPGHSPHPKRSRTEHVASMSACRGCGKTHLGDIDACNFRTHPDFNRSHKEQSFAESYIGKFYASKDKSSLNSQLKKSGSELVPYNVTSSSSASSNKPYQAKYTPGKGTTGSGFRSKQSSECQLCSLSNKSTNTNSIIHAHFLIGNYRLQVKTLLDTGAESGSYINAKVATWLTKRGILSVNRRKIVCSCFGDCKMIETCMTASLIFKQFVNNSNDEQNKLCLDFWVIDNLPYDVVIGNLDIKQPDYNPTETECKLFRVYRPN
jgi:hypothetical protein